MYPLQKYRSTRILLGLLAKPVSMGIVASAGAILCSPTASSAANFNLNAGNNNSGVFNFTREIDNVTISTTGLYALDVFGAEGGSNGFFRTGGKGDKAKGNISLDAGTILSILVGQRGENGLSGSNGGTFGGGGGGGASFVVTVLNGTPTPLIRGFLYKPSKRGILEINETGLGLAAQRSRRDRSNQKTSETHSDHIN
jgi:hypothetical protein